MTAPLKPGSGGKTRFSRIPQYPFAGLMGFLLLIKCCVEIVHLSNYELYLYAFQWLPSRALPFRLLLSWGARMVLLVSAVGVLWGKEFFRKLAVFLCLGAVLTLYWKHPYQAFVYTNRYYGVDMDYLCRQVSHLGSQLGFPGVDPGSLIRGQTLMTIIMDLLFYSLMIFLGTRRQRLGESR